MGFRGEDVSRNEYWLNLGDFLDTYRNLSYKSILGKLWVSNFCEQADFVIKADDDMFVDLYATFFFTRHIIEHMLSWILKMALVMNWVTFPFLFILWVIPENVKSKW